MGGSGSCAMNSVASAKGVRNSHSVAGNAGKPKTGGNPGQPDPHTFFQSLKSLVRAAHQHSRCLRRHLLLTAKTASASAKCSPNSSPKSRSSPSTPSRPRRKPGRKPGTACRHNHPRWLSLRVPRRPTTAASAGPCCEVGEGRDQPRDQDGTGTRQACEQRAVQVRPHQLRDAFTHRHCQNNAGKDANAAA